MKKVVITIIIIVVLLVVGILAINHYESNDEVTEKTTKVGAIFNGYIDDKSWCQSHFEGIYKAAEELNLDVIYKEYVTQDTIRPTIDELAASGCEIIIANSALFSDAIIDAAEHYPEIFFFHATGVSSGKNLCTYFGRMYQIRYLTGIVAGMQTETNQIGYAAAFPTDEVNRGINAFTLGVRAVNPDATVYVRWINSWGADMAARNISTQLCTEHDIDVLAMHTDSVEPLNVANELGIMSIGYNLDNSHLYGDGYLTAAVWDWEKFYIPNILKCLQGKLDGQNLWLNIDTGIIDIAPLSSVVSADTHNALDAELDRLVSGTYDVFYGPIYDNTGVLRIYEDECMTDDAMLNEFDWYVDGVIIDEE